MSDAMASASSTPAPTPRRSLRRDPARGYLGGVCAGIGRDLGIDPLIVRVAFVIAALAGGLGVAAYVLAWALLPASSVRGTAVVQSLRGGRAAIEVGLGVGLLLLSVLLTFRELGLWFSDAIVWPAVLIAAGGALIWRQSQGGSTPTASTTPRSAATGATGGTTAAPDVAAPRAADVSRTGLGVALVIAAGFAFLQATGSLSAARDVLLAAIAVAVVLGVIFAPWVVRLVRSLGSERAERIRSQERAEVAAHLHDSVLQTLALVQKRADDPRAVAQLARRQERELRAWLNADRPSAGRLGGALQQAAEEIEDDHGVPIEVVTVGDADLDDAGQALVAAAREAMQNAAKFGGAGPVDVYAEASDDRISVFVRDRGPGFEIDAIPDDRRGVRESIIGRMQRNGGRAEVHSDTGGTEVELILERS
jgi:signal transduction histidine kinase